MDAGDSLAGALSVEQLRPVSTSTRSGATVTACCTSVTREPRPTLSNGASGEPFHDAGYELSLERNYDPETDVRILTHGWVLVARPPLSRYRWYPVDERRAALLTIGSTLLVGGIQWYQIDPTGDPLALLRAWPFVAAVLGVLAVHELGHYVASRYHGVEASLPYFIPFPTH